MKIRNVFPSQYFGAADVDGETLRHTITKVVQETVGNELKVVMAFADSDQRLVLNKTNANARQNECGGEADDWCGHAIERDGATTEYMGDQRAGLRVRIPEQAAGAAVATAAQPQDEVPF